MTNNFENRNIVTGDFRKIDLFSKPFNFIFADCRKSIIYNGFKSQFNIKSKNYL